MGGGGGYHKKALTFKERKAKITVHLQDLNVFVGVIRCNKKRNPKYTMIQDIIYLLQKGKQISIQC